MKFGKYLGSRQLELPEYSGHFIDYKALKKLIKRLAIDNGHSGQVDIQKTLKENKASFFFRVERELEKVNSFYLEKQANLAVTLDLLNMKKIDLFIKSNDYIRRSNDSQSANFKNSITYLNLYQNFKKVHQDLLRLQQFIELNETGFLKVVKKWDKRSKSRTRELFIQSAVSVQPVFHKNEINELSDLVTHSLFELELIMDGDYSCLVNYNEKVYTNVDPSKTRHNSVGGSSETRNYLQNEEIDELYSSFVNIATTKEPDMKLLTRWIDKVKSTKSSTTESKFKLSKIFTLAVNNLKISDTFLHTFLEMINYQVDFAFVSDDFNNNKTILHECCSIGTQENNVHVIFNNGVTVINSTDSINHSRTFIVKYIMENLSDLQNLLRTKDFNGRSCLHYASQNNRLDLLDLILPSFPKSAIDDLDKDSMSALLLAIKHGHFEVIKKLVESGSFPFPKSDDSKLQYLPINYACKTGNYQIVEYLLSCSNPDGALINQQDVEGLFPLHVISRSGHFELIKLLIQHGADVNQVDGLNKWTPIFYAALEGHVRATQELIKFGAKPDMVDEDGYNVLYYCVLDGHIDVLNELLGYKNLWNRNKCESGSPNGHFSITPMLKSDTHSMKILDENDNTSEDSGSIEKNIDAIPDLQLPPPILPLRRYGHNFLDQKVLIELMFPDENEFINLFNSSTDSKPGRLTLTSDNSDIVPRNILLPVADEIKSSNNCVFQTDVDSLNEFRIDFEIFPKFGTRLIAKTTALTFSQINTSSPEVNSILLPLFDLRLKNIGDLKFNYQVIFPYSGSLLETSKFDTYWKSSTSFVKNRQTLNLNAAGGLSPNNFLSPTNGAHNANHASGNLIKDNMLSTNELISSSTSSSVVTATSLSGEYLRVKICLLNDGTPVVCPNWSISITEKIDLYLPNLSLEQLNSITNDLFDYPKVIHDLSNMGLKDIRLIKKLLRIIYLPLEVVLEILSVDINLNLEFVFPSIYELEQLPFIRNIQLNLNRFIDLTLTNVFNHIRNLKVKAPQNGTGRSIIFSSSNSLVCKILNWKQPNFPVFLLMNGIAYNNNAMKFERRSTNGLLIENNDETINTKTSPSKSNVKVGSQLEVTIRSIKEAVNFSISNNLIGLITSIHLLDLVPKLIPLIRSRGLILVASSDFGDYETEESIQNELDTYTRTEVNGLRFDDVLTFKGDISM